MPKLPKNPKQTYGNLKDKYDAAQRNWDRVSDFSQQVNQRFSGKGKHDDIEGYDRDDDGLDEYEDEDLAEAERAAIADQESSGSFYQSQDESPYHGKDLKSRMLRMRGIRSRGASTGAAASVLFVGGILISMATGSSFWTAFEKNLTNDASDDARTNAILHRAFNNMFKTTVCTKGKLICKMKTATKEYVKKWKDGLFSVKGTVVDAEGNPRGPPDQLIDDVDKQMKDGERLIITEVTDIDGTRIDNVADLNAHADQNVGTRDRMAKVISPARAFFTDNFKKLTAKFSINKAKASAEERRPGGVTEEDARSAIDKGVADNDPTKKKNWAKLGMRGVQGVPGTLNTGVEVACMAYNVTRIAVGTVKAKWVSDLVRFGWPFVRLVSKLQDGSATEADFQEVENRFNQLVDYLSESEANDLLQRVGSRSLTEEDKKKLEQFGIKADDPPDKQRREILEITNKSALDSQGLQMAFYGDNTGLTEFTNKFTTAIIGSTTLTADYIIGKVQEAGALGGDQLAGKRNIRSACILNRALGAGLAGTQIAKCAAEAAAVIPFFVDCVPQFVAGAAAWYAAFQLLKDAMAAGVAAALIKSAPIIPLDLRGPAAGNVIASAISLFLAHKSQSSGLKPALSLNAASTYLASTQHRYDQHFTELAQYRARSAPFDITNQYSFIGQIVGALNPYPVRINQPLTGFSVMANIFGASSSLFTNVVNASYSQPQLLNLNREYLMARTNDGECAKGEGESRIGDEEKYLEGMLCDWSGRAVYITSPRVLKWAEEDATGKTDHLADAVAWMRGKQTLPEAHIGGGTKDETCSEVTAGLSIDVEGIGKCDDSEKESIDDSGKPVPGSQYEKFIKYCTGERALEMASTDIDVDVASMKEQDWHTGKQCGKTYDSNGVSSLEENFDRNKDTGEGSLMMDYFAYYYNMCYVQYAIANGEANCAEAKTKNEGSGDVCSLLNNPNIQYEQKTTEEDLKKLCAGETVKSLCGNDMNLNPLLINAITSNANKYKVTINNFGFHDDRHVANDCQPGKQHWKGNAIDISKIARAGSADGLAAGSGVYGSVNFDGQNGALVADYASDFLATLPPDRGGVGQQGCSSTFNPRFQPGSVTNGNHFFADACNHLHIDVRDRNNVNVP